MAQMNESVPDVTDPNAQAAQPGQSESAKLEDNKAEAIKFIKSKLQSAFNEQDCTQLFQYYTLDKSTDRLQPPDVRKLLLDILSASEWPLVVPDESLEAVLHELCLNDEGSISWIEFKSFCVFLQDKPLLKLFEIITKQFSKEQLLVSRLITITPAPNAQEQGQEQEQAQPPQQAGAEEKEQAQEQSYYDRNKWKSAVMSLVPQAKQVFIYFMDGYQILALAIGDFETALAEPAAAELRLDASVYLATIRAFDSSNDMFPPIARSGGLKSKVARKIADSYLIARQWDTKHLKLVEKAGSAAATVSVKWTEFDERYKVNERVNATMTSVIDSVKAFNEKHQLTRRLSNSAKQLDDKFGISQRIGAVSTKIQQNERVQAVSTKVNDTIKTAVKTIDDIGQETQQLVQEKQQHNVGSEPAPSASQEGAQPSV